MLTLLPYIKPPNEPYYQHIKDGSRLGFEGWGDWYTPKEKDKKECLGTYAGPAQPMNKSLSPFGCEDMAHDWAPCFACNLVHHHGHSVVLKLRALCEKSALDKYYHMDIDEEGFVTYYGFTGTIIRYDRDKEVWNISVSHKPGVTGLSKAGFGTLVLGNHRRFWRPLSGGAEQFCSS